MIEPLAHLEINRRHRFLHSTTCAYRPRSVDRRRRRRRKINTARKTFASHRRRSGMLRRNVFSFGVNVFLAFDVNFVISRTFPLEMIHCLLIFSCGVAFSDQQTSSMSDEFASLLFAKIGLIGRWIAERRFIVACRPI